MITAVVAVVAGERQASMRSEPARSAAADNSGLVGQHSTHINTEGLHILCDEDSVLLGLVPKCIEALSEREHRVLRIG